jgi:hypothetical protein
MLHRRLKMGALKNIVAGYEDDARRSIDEFAGYASVWGKDAKLDDLGIRCENIMRLIDKYKRAKKRLKFAKEAEGAAV